MTKGKGDGKSGMTNRMANFPTDKRGFGAAQGEL